MRFTANEINGMLAVMYEGSKYDARQRTSRGDNTTNLNFSDTLCSYNPRVFDAWCEIGVHVDPMASHVTLHPCGMADKYGEALDILGEAVAISRAIHMSWSNDPRESIADYVRSKYELRHPLDSGEERQAWLDVKNNGMWPLVGFKALEALVHRQRILDAPSDWRFSYDCGMGDGDMWIGKYQPPKDDRDMQSLAAVERELFGHSASMIVIDPLMKYLDPKRG